jgi:hypothetical protein
MDVGLGLPAGSVGIRERLHRGDRVLVGADLAGVGWEAVDVASPEDLRLDSSQDFGVRRVAVEQSARAEQPCAAQCGNQKVPASHVSHYTPSTYGGARQLPPPHRLHRGDSQKQHPPRMAAGHLLSVK